LSGIIEPSFIETLIFALNLMIKNNGNLK